MGWLVPVLLGLLVGLTGIALWWLIQKSSAFTPSVTVQAPPAILIPAPKGEVHARSRTMGPDIEIELRSGSLNRVLGTYTCKTHSRPPVLTHANNQYVASHQKADGQWVYRRVGVERSPR